MLLCTTSHAFMQARQQADFFEGGFAKLVPFFFFFLFFLNIFSFFVFISPCLFPGLVPHPYGVVGGLTMGSSSGVRPTLAGNQVVNK